RALLFLGDSHVYRLVTRVLAAARRRVDVAPRADEHPTSRLEVGDGVCGRASRAIGHEGAAVAVGAVTLPDVPAVEEMIQEPGAARVGEELGPVADEAPGGNPVLEPDAARPVVHHLGHRASPRPDLLGHGADVLLG